MRRGGNNSNRAGVIQDLFSWRADGEINRGRIQHQFSPVKKLDEKKKSIAIGVSVKQE